MPWGLFIIAMQATAFVGVYIAFSVFCSLGGKEFFSVVTYQKMALSHFNLPSLHLVFMVITVSVKCSINLFELTLM